MPGHDHLVFDFHEHHDPDHHPITHEHDDHPRHHHDANGSVIYLDLGKLYPEWAKYGTIKSVIVDDVGHGGTDAAPIGSGGYDITRRTR